MSTPVQKSISLGSLKAAAEAIEQMFGAEDDVLDAEGAGLLGLDEELDELYGSDEDLDWFLMEEDEDDEVAGDFSVDPMESWAILGRREMANRARSQFRGNGGSSDSFRAGAMYGYMQSLTDQGMPDGALPDDRFGLFRKFRPFAGPRKLVDAAMKGALGGPTAIEAARQVGVGTASALTGAEVPVALAQPVLTPTPAFPAPDGAGSVRAAPLSAIAHQLGQRAASGLGVLSGAFPTATAPVVAVRQTLPPVYVADKMGFEGDADLIEGRGSVLRGARATLPVEEQFGATALAGFVQGQVRRPAKHAAKVAAKRGATMLAVSSMDSTGAPFVEDPGAEPVLFGNGQIWDSVYGELAAVPCPSCAPVDERAAFGRTGNRCIVCDDKGALLTPTSDVSQWSGGVQYGIVPLLIPLVTAGASAAAPVFAEGAKGWLGGQKQRKAEDLAEREQEILARLRKKEDEVSPEKLAPETVTRVEAEAIPSIVPKGVSTVISEAVSGLFDDDEFGAFLEDEGDDDFGFAVLGDEVSGAEIDALLEDEESPSELESVVLEAFGLSEDEFAVLEDDEDEDEDGFGAEDASRGNLMDRTVCVRALVPASYLRDVQPGRGVR